MSYREAFWLAASAAAPVIALAAVVALPDARATEFQAVASSYDTFFDELFKSGVLSKSGEEFLAWMKEENRRSRPALAATRIRQLVLSNVIIQAGLLAVSLSALATSRNLTPPWVVIALEVSGILLLSWTVTGGTTIRRKMKAYADHQRMERSAKGRVARDTDDSPAETEQG